MESSTRTKLARLTSNIINPFIVSALVTALISREATDSLGEALRWTFISIGFSVLPVLVVTLYLVHRGTIQGLFINARQERYSVYLLATACTLTGAISLYKLGAPPVLVASFVTALTSVIVFMFINFLWKISVHTAFVAASVTMLIIVFGTMAAVTAFLVPLTGWARIELNRHSPAQVTAGAVLAAGISFAVFYTSGLVHII